TRRNQLTLFMGFLFISFYGFYTSQAVHVAVDRFAMAFYPTIAVFLALLLSGIAHKIKWKHALKLISFVVTIYLACLCAVPSFSERLGTFRNIKEQYYPNAKAMQWVRDNLKDGEKVLSFRFKPDFYYSDKYGIDKNKIHSFWYNLGEHDTSEKLLAYCRENKISYIIFPYGPKFFDNLVIRNYLKENKDNEFIEAAKFNLNENYICILKVRDKN
ncbi:MAG: hypothetical protein KAJ10_13115, partial [Thermodesulfovibrionia bacterium]|nr:hypothetical protein [Thermodesulfovibrionia bacterium]